MILISFYCMGKSGFEMRLINEICSKQAYPSLDLRQKYITTDHLDIIKFFPIHQKKMNCDNFLQ